MHQVYPSPLELRREIDCCRHYLKGRPLCPGCRVELLTDEGWMRGRYEWTGDPGDKPLLLTEFNRVLILDDRALLRWAHSRN